MLSEDCFVRYIILLSKIPGKQLSEKLVREHVQHLRKLDERGLLESCGPFSDVEGGMIILRAASHEEAMEIAESDPFVSSGVERYELRTWQLSCEENNHLGMG